MQFKMKYIAHEDNLIHPLPKSTDVSIFLFDIHSVVNYCYLTVSLDPYEETVICQCNSLNLNFSFLYDELISMFLKVKPTVICSVF